MPNNHSHLFINRLYITKDNIPVYNEQFHYGVNIIRGENSAGKSTIADFIFYALGGNYTGWKPEARLCDYVFVEVTINDAVLTLKRQVTDGSQQPMDIFWGSLDEALKSNLAGWKSFPFRRSPKKKSFSQELFNIMGIPEVRGDADSNITMHQLLRLIYIDQLSNVQSLLRDEPFDSPLTRVTIGDLLFGTFDDSIYMDRLDLREAERKKEYLNEQVKHLIAVLEESEQEIDSEKIDKTISDKETQLKKIFDSIKESDKKNKTFEVEKKVSDEVEDARVDYLKKQTKLSNAKNRLHELLLEIQDSRHFIQTLEARIRAFDEAELVRHSFSELKVSYCPICSSGLSENIDASLCHLCKNPISIDVKKTNLLRMKQELSFQIKESKSLLLIKEDDYAIFDRQLPEFIEEVKISKLALEEVLTRVRTVRNKQIDNLFLKRGQLESELSFLQKQRKAVTVLETLKRNLFEVENRIDELGKSIEKKVQQQKSRLDLAQNTIQTISFELLKADLPREEIFQAPEKIYIDFKKNTFAVNGRNDFSASSIVYLKNSIHFAIAFASLLHDFFRYPRLLVCDNIEDKGMEEGRSHNFQRKIVELSNRLSKPHQIVYTTSMIAPELDNSELCVGEKYSQTNKSLKFA